MNSYELLGLIGEANEDYVLEADGGKARPRPRWKIWAAAAACAALALCAYPVYKTASLSGATEQNASLPLHAYTVVEEDGGVLAEDGLESITTQATADSADDAVSEDTIFAAPTAGGEPAADAGGPTADGDFKGHTGPFTAPAGDAPADAAGGAEATPIPAPEEAALGIPTIDQNTAIAQYHRLVLNCGLEDNPPEWYAGAWLDNDQPDNVARLAVSIVKGFHTPELEAQIQDWCGEVVFVQDRKYSYARLKSMVDQINAALMDLQDETWSTFSFMHLDIMNNCLEIGFYGLPSDGALAFLAQLDPEGDAIRIQAFADRVVADEQLPDEPTAEPTPTPRIEEPFAVSSAPDTGENAQPASTDGAGHSIPGSTVEDLPQPK